MTHSKLLSRVLSLDYLTRSAKFAGAMSLKLTCVSEGPQSSPQLYCNPRTSGGSCAPTASSHALNETSRKWTVKMCQIKSFHFVFDQIPSQIFYCLCQLDTEQFAVNNKRFYYSTYQPVKLCSFSLWFFFHI